MKYWACVTCEKWYTYRTTGEAQFCPRCFKAVITVAVQADTVVNDVRWEVKPLL